MCIRDRIDFDFTKPLKLHEQVQRICRDKGWEYGELPGDLGLFEKLLGGDWADSLIVLPGQKVVASYDEKVVGAQKV